MFELLELAYRGLRDAARADRPSDRYLAAHLAALRAGAAVLAARATPRRPGRIRSVWELLPAVAPELREWAEFFALSARVRSAIEAGRQVSARQADDLLRDAERFVIVVRSMIDPQVRIA